MKSYSSSCFRCHSRCPDSATIFGAAGCQMRITPSCRIVHEVSAFEAGGEKKTVDEWMLLVQVLGVFLSSNHKGICLSADLISSRQSSLLPKRAGRKSSCCSRACGHNPLQSVNDIAQHPRSEAMAFSRQQRQWRNTWRCPAEADHA